MYVQSLISIPFVLSKIWPGQATILKSIWLRGDNSRQYTGWDYGSYTPHFLSLPSIYKPSFISITFLLNKIWAGQATTMKTWLRGDNYVNIQGRIMVLVHCLSFLLTLMYL